MTKRTLHEAMLEALPHTQPGWLTFAELAERIADRDLYTRGDAARADAGQLRRRATQSNGYYVHLLRSREAKFAGGKTDGRFLAIPRDRVLLMLVS